MRRTPARLTSRSKGAGEAHRVDHAAMLGGEDQVMVRLLVPVLIGDLPFKGLQLAPFLQDSGAELGKREHGL
jgi:hypothetical protein